MVAALRRSVPESLEFVGGLDELGGQVADLIDGHGVTVLDVDVQRPRHGTVTGLHTVEVGRGVVSADRAVLTVHAARPGAGAVVLPVLCLLGGGGDRDANHRVREVALGFDPSLAEEAPRDVLGGLIDVAAP
jgi:hypothetical protein